MDKIGNTSLTLFQRPKVANLTMPFSCLKSFHCFLLPIPQLKYLGIYVCLCICLSLCVNHVFFFFSVLCDTMIFRDSCGPQKGLPLQELTPREGKQKALLCYETNQPRAYTPNIPFIKHSNTQLTFSLPCITPGSSIRQQGTASIAQSSPTLSKWTHHKLTQCTFPALPISSC